MVVEVGCIGIAEVGVGQVGIAKEVKCADGDIARKGKGLWWGLGKGNGGEILKGVSWGKRVFG